MLEACTYSSTEIRPGSRHSKNFGGAFLRPLLDLMYAVLS